MDTAGCTNLTGAARLVRLLKVDGYSAATSMGDGGCVKSRWNVGGHNWEIDLYPATTNSSFWSYSRPLCRRTEPTAANKASPFLTCYDEFGRASETRLVVLKIACVTKTCPGDVRVTLACLLVDGHGVLQPSEERSVSASFSRSSCYTSYPVLVLVERRDLEASGYLKNDTLTLQCTITVLKELPAVATVPGEEEEVVIPVAPPSNLHRHLGELLREETGADVTFVVAGESFAAHKLILAARSPVLMAQFFGHMREKRSRCVVEVKDVEPSVFKAVLHFIYTDTVPELEGPAATTAMAQHLLAAADRYGLERLKAICERVLSRGIDVETAATTLALAERHSCAELKARCVQYIGRTPAILDAVLATEGYMHLMASCPLVFTDLLKSVRERKN